MGCGSSSSVHPIHPDGLLKYGATPQQQQMHRQLYANNNQPKQQPTYVQSIQQQSQSHQQRPQVQYIQPQRPMMMQQQLQYNNNNVIIPSSQATMAPSGYQNIQQATQQYEEQQIRRQSIQQQRPQLVIQQSLMQPMQQPMQQQMIIQQRPQNSQPIIQHQQPIQQQQPIQHRPPQPHQQSRVAARSNMMVPHARLYIDPTSFGSNLYAPSSPAPSSSTPKKSKKAHKKSLSMPRVDVAPLNPHLAVDDEDEILAEEAKKRNDEADRIAAIESAQQKVIDDAYALQQKSIALQAAALADRNQREALELQQLTQQIAYEAQQAAQRETVLHQQRVRAAMVAEQKQREGVEQQLHRDQASALAKQQERKSKRSAANTPSASPSNAATTKRSIRLPTDSGETRVVDIDDNNANEYSIQIHREPSPSDGLNGSPTPSAPPSPSSAPIVTPKSTHRNDVKSTIESSATTTTLSDNDTSSLANQNQSWQVQVSGQKSNLTPIVVVSSSPSPNMLSTHNLSIDDAHNQVTTPNSISTIDATHAYSDTVSDKSSVSTM